MWSGACVSLVESLSALRLPLTGMPCSFTWHTSGRVAPSSSSHGQYGARRKPRMWRWMMLKRSGRPHVVSAQGRPEDATLAALDDDSAVFSRILMAVEVIAAHHPKREIRVELREILEAVRKAREVRIAGR